MVLDRGGEGPEECTNGVCATGLQAYQREKHLHSSLQAQSAIIPKGDLLEPLNIYGCLGLTKIIFQKCCLR